MERSQIQETLKKSDHHDLVKDSTMTEGKGDIKGLFSVFTCLMTVMIFSEIKNTRRGSGFEERL